MENHVLYKRLQKPLIITYRERGGAKPLKAEVFSFDSHVSKFTFDIQPSYAEDEIDLTGADVIVTLTYPFEIDGEVKTGKIIDVQNGEVVNPTRVAYTVTEDLDGYTGNVTMNISIIMPADGKDIVQKIDITDLSFKCTESILDKCSAHIIPEFAYNGYQELVDEAIEQVKEDIKEGICGDSFVQQQTDWNEMDTEAVSFIKNKPEIPSVAGLASETYVAEAIAAIDVPDVSGKLDKTEAETTYAKKSEIPTPPDLSTYAQKTDLEPYATKDDVAEAISEVDLTGYARESYVDSAVEAAKPDLTPYALKSEVPSIDGLATEASVDEKLLTKANVDDVYDKATTDQKIAEAAAGGEVDLTSYLKKSEAETTYAKKTDVPSIDGLASEQFVTEKIAAIDIPEAPDLTGYAKTADVDLTYAKKTDVPSIEGLATETYVNDKIAEASTGEVDLSEYDKSTEVDTKIANATSVLAKAVDVTTEISEAVAGLATAAEVTAVKTEIEGKIPDVSGFATTAALSNKADKTTTYTKVETDTAIANAVSAVPAPDLSNYDTKAEVTEKITNATKDLAKKSELPDTSSFMTGSQVDEKIAAIDIPDVPDISGKLDKTEAETTYAKKVDTYTKEEVDEKVGNAGGGSVAWGDISGNLWDQEDLQRNLDKKQNALVAGKNIAIDPNTNVIESIVGGTPSFYVNVSPSVIHWDGSTFAFGKLYFDVFGELDLPSSGAFAPNDVHIYDFNTWNEVKIGAYGAYINNPNFTGGVAGKSRPGARLLQTSFGFAGELEDSVADGVYFIEYTFTVPFEDNSGETIDVKIDGSTILILKR